MRISDWSSDVCSSDLLSGALYASAALLVAVALILGRWMPMPVVKVEDKEMSAQRKELSARLAFTPRSGPIAVEIDYRVAPEKARRFYILVQQLQRSRKRNGRSEEHTSELQSLMRTSYADFC